MAFFFSSLQATSTPQKGMRCFKRAQKLRPCLLVQDTGSLWLSEDGCNVSQCRKKCHVTVLSTSVPFLITHHCPHLSPLSYPDAHARTHRQTAHLFIHYFAFKWRVSGAPSEPRVRCPFLQQCAFTEAFKFSCPLKINLHG